MKECSNCGEKFKQGDGYPENKFECCCCVECWLEFTDQPID